MDIFPDPLLQSANPFYQVTEKDLKHKHGHLIRSEPLTGSAALDDASATYRVIYQSTSGVADRLDQPIGVSGIIAFPTATAPAGGWPVISWAHGTVGSADKCAPSMDSDELGPLQTPGWASSAKSTRLRTTCSTPSCARAGRWP